MSKKSPRSYRGGPDDPDREHAFIIIQSVLGGTPLGSAIGALCHSLAFAAAYATDDFAAADKFLDKLLPDIKAHIRLNAAEIAEAKSRMAIRPGSA